MSDFLLFIASLLIGFMSKKYFRDNTLLQKATYLTLLVTIFNSFYHLEFTKNSFILITLGILLSIIPFIFSLINKTPDSLIFSTYGGGNRGLLLVSLLTTNKTSDFILVDLGIFITLLLIFPLGFNINHNIVKKNIKHAINLLLILIISATISDKHSTHLFIDQIKEYNHHLLIIFSAIQLGSNLNLEKNYSKWFFKNFFITRGLTLLIVTPIAFLLTGVDSIILILLVIILPISSIAISLISNNVNNELKEKIAYSSVMSNILYLAILIFFKVSQVLQI